MARMRVRPSRRASMVNMVIFLVITIAAVVGAGPRVDSGVLLMMVLMGLGAASLHAYNAFSKRGISVYEIDGEDVARRPEDDLTFDERLRRLERLRDEHLISDDEYEAKREAILRETW